jgi:predicted dehydrogenase
MSFGIAVVGLDHWYTAHGVCDIAAASSLVTLAGIADPNPARQDWARERYPQTTVVGDAAALFARDDIHLVALCAPTAAAPALAEAALAAGKHVISVKPPARTLAELDAVIAVAQTAGRLYGSFEGLQRLHPSTLLLRTLIADGAIGTVMSYHQVGHGGLPSPWPGEPGGAPSWWIDRAQVPGGAWLDHAIYAVDLARFVIDGEIDAATGLIERRVHTHLEIEDYGASLMRLRPANGGSVSLLFEDTWTAAPGGGAHRQQWIGTHGHIRAERGGWTVTRGGQETHHGTPTTPFFQLDALAQILQSGDTPPFGPHDARANLAACLAVYENAVV